MDVSCKQLKKHIKTVSLGGEYGHSGNITKFTKNKVYWYFADDSEHTQDDVKSVHTLFNEISQLTNVKFIEKQDASEPYIRIYFGNEETFNKYLPKRIEQPGVLGYANWNARSHSIFQSNVFVSSTLEGIVRKDVLREELTQAIGNTGDTPYNNTIFYQYKYKNKEYFDKYFEIDKQLLRLLYHPSIHPGMTHDDIDNMKCDITQSDSASNGQHNDKTSTVVMYMCVFIAVAFLLSE